MTARPDDLVKDFHTWGAFLDACRALTAHAPGGNEWVGHATWEQALNMATHGWPEGMTHVRDMILPAVETRVSKMTHSAAWTWDVTGAAYDVGEYLSGVPECWLAPQVEEHKPALTLAVNLTSSAGIGIKHLMRRGASLVGLTLALQAAGYVVTVHSIIGVNYRNDAREPHDAWVRVQLTDDAGGPLDTDRLLFALVHTANSRLLGYNLVSPHSLVWPKGPSPWGADLYLDRYHLHDADWESVESANAWIDRTFQTLTKREV